MWKMHEKEHKIYVKNYLIVVLMERTNNMTVVCIPFTHYSWIATTKLGVATKVEIIWIHNKENPKIIIIFFTFMVETHTNTTLNSSKKLKRNQ